MNRTAPELTRVVIGEGPNQLAIKILDSEVLHGDRVKVDADRLNNRLKFKVVGRKAGEPAKEPVGAR